MILLLPTRARLWAAILAFLHSKTGGLLRINSGFSRNRSSRRRYSCGGHRAAGGSNSSLLLSNLSRSRYSLRKAQPPIYSLAASQKISSPAGLLNLGYAVILVTKYLDGEIRRALYRKPGLMHVGAPLGEISHYRNTIIDNLPLASNNLSCTWRYYRILIPAKVQTQVRDLPILDVMIKSPIQHPRNDPSAYYIASLSG